MFVKRFINRVRYNLKALDSEVRPFASGKWDYFTIALDYLFCRCFLKVEAGEYKQYKFPYYKHRYRKYFLLKKHQRQYDNINVRVFALSKYTFYTFIRDLYQREIILAPHCGEETFVNFLKKNKKVIVKPNTGYQGNDIQVLHYTDDLAAKKFFAALTPGCAVVCEEFIRQHPLMMKLNPHSVNTLRIVTLMIDGEIDIIAAVLKMGVNADSITDNMSRGGIGAQVDPDTGIVYTFGYDFKYHKYPYHPVTGEKIIGLQIPNWKQAVDLVKTAHKRLPQCMLYGWDIAITETGVDIVEGNTSPGTRIMQRMDQIPKGKKLVPLLKKDRLKNKRDEDLEKFVKIYNEQCKMG